MTDHLGKILLRLFVLGLVALSLFLLLRSPVPAADFFDTPNCVGDCNLDRNVTISELITSINITLGRKSVAFCLPTDTNSDKSISINELTAAIRSSVRGCQ